MDRGAPHRGFRSRVTLLHVAFQGMGYVASHSLEVLPDSLDLQVRHPC